MIIGLGMIITSLSTFVLLDISGIGAYYCHDPSYCDVIGMRSEASNATILLFIGIIILITCGIKLLVEKVRK